MLKLAYGIYPEASLPPTRGRRGPPVGPRILSPDWEGCHEKFREDTYTFILEKIVKVMSAQRLARGLPPAEASEDAEEYGDQLNPDDGAPTKHAKSQLTAFLIAAAIQRALDNANKVTGAQIRAFLDICRIKYLRAKIEPGMTFDSSVRSVSDSSFKGRLSVRSERNPLASLAPR